MPETDRYDCKMCRRSNNVDNMVFCPKCEEWFHYQCVGVDDAVANQSWMCATCLIGTAQNPLRYTSTPILTLSARAQEATGLSGVLPPVVATVPPEMPIGPTTIAPGPLANPGQSILTEQARESLQWVQEQRAVLEREMEINHQLELERKRLELKRLTNEAMMGILTQINMSNGTSHRSDFGFQVTQQQLVQL